MENELVGQGAASLIGQGAVMSQIRTAYQTAVAVQQPRNIDIIVQEVKREFEYAGSSGYYSWKVTGKDNKKVTVEGLSIGGEMIIARAYGNCAIETTVEDHSDHVIFTSHFIDLEKGFTISRTFKLTKGKAPGKYGKERWEDMQYQIGQSKAIRNVIKAAVPSWLQEECLRISKQSVINKIDHEGIAKARDKVLEFLAGNGVTEEMVINTMEKPVNHWTSEDVATLRGMCQQIHDGAEKPEELFVQTPAEKHKATVQKTQQDRKEETRKKVEEAMGPTTTDAPAPTTAPVPIGDQVASSPSPEPSEAPEKVTPRSFSEYRKEMEDIKTYDELQIWLEFSAEDLDRDIVPNSRTRWNNLVEARSNHLAEKEGKVHNAGAQHVEPESEITTAAPAPDADPEPAVTTPATRKTIDDFLVEYRQIDDPIKCSRYLLSNYDDLKEFLTPEEFNEFQKLADDHIVGLRK